MIGIIGAMAVEVDGFIGKLSETVTEKHIGISFVKGKFNGIEVVVAQCGIGKVNAAVCAQAMIIKYSPKLIINTGVAGSVSPDVKIGDVVIAESSVQHDLDLDPLGIENVFIPCAPTVIECLEKAAKKYGNCHKGIIATGDQFIDSSEVKSKIRNDVNALACEMEGGSIAHVCALYNIDCGIVRTVSDNADGDAMIDFGEFIKEYAKKSALVISEFLRLWF